MSAMTYRTLRQHIERAGGIGGRTQLAERWGVSRQYVNRLAEDPTFPKAIGRVGMSDAYLLAECDEWREARRSA